MWGKAGTIQGVLLQFFQLMLWTTGLCVVCCDMNWLTAFFTFFLLPLELNLILVSADFNKLNFCTIMKKNVTGYIGHLVLLYIKI